MNIISIIKKCFLESPVLPDDPILEELKQEEQRILQEMVLYSEGRGAENLSMDESCKITFDLIKRSREQRIGK